MRVAYITGKKSSSPDGFPKASSITEPRAEAPSPACQEDGEIEQCLCSQSAQASTGGSIFGDFRDTATSGNPPHALRHSGMLLGFNYSV